MANEEVYERIREINKNDDRVYTLEELAEADIDPEKEFFITKTVRTISAEKTIGPEIMSCINSLK